MSEEQDTESTIQVETDTKEEMKEPNIEELRSMLEKERETVSSHEKKLQYLLADFENLKRRTEAEIQTRVNSMLTELILKFLSIYDDFIRAKEALGQQHVDTKGLDGILKNMNSFLSECGVMSIEAIGEIFDPKFHEAIAIKKDPSLDNDTITKEIRKGYILQNKVIRPSLVEISKTLNNKQEGENNG